MATERALVIEQPGLLTTVQDLGHQGMAQFGVSPGGALDRKALVLGNRLLGNDPGDAVLECTLTGPEITFASDTVIALTGSDFGPLLDGQAIPMWEPVAVETGAKLSFAPAPKDGGARTFLCIAGGISVDPVLGSRSTNLVGQFGGYAGRALQAGDRVPIGESRLDRERILRRRLVSPIPTYEKTITVNVVLGPQLHRFSDAGIAAFLDGPYIVTAKADRTGIRLSGPVIEHRDGADLISEGIAYGAIQVPGDGQPIVLLAARQTVGGYTKIATVIGADLDRVAQLRPGGAIRFDAVDVARARAMTSEYLLSYAENAVTEQPGLHAMKGTKTMGGWDPNGVIRVLETAERVGVTHLRLEIPEAGISLALDRASSTQPETTDRAVSADDGDIVVAAPVLGTFYRRRSPEEPPLVSLGDRVEAGALVGLIEVMKTYYDVTAPVAGTVSRLLAEDGHYVEYGAPLLHLSPER